MASPSHILGFSGSLRQASINSGLLRAAQTVLPADMTLEIYDLTPIPLFCQDLVDQGNVPVPVQAFKARLAAADGLLIATPEYNYSIPGVLKNAIDWASRPVADSPLNGKPLAIMGAGGAMGTSRAQYHLRQVAVYTNMLPLNKPEVTVQFASQKFDAAGNLTDEAVRQKIRLLLEALQAWINRLRE